MMERKVEFDVVAEINLIVARLSKRMFIKSTQVRQETALAPLLSFMLNRLKEGRLECLNLNSRPPRYSSRRFS